MTRRAFSAHRVIRLKGHMSSIWSQDVFVTFDQKKCCNSKSTNSFGIGPIFLDSLGQEISRNVVVGSVYAFGKKLDRREDFL